MLNLVRLWRAPESIYRHSQTHSPSCTALGSFREISNKDISRLWTNFPNCILTRKSRLSFLSESLESTSESTRHENDLLSPLSLLLSLSSVSSVSFSKRPSFSFSWRSDTFISNSSRHSRLLKCSSHPCTGFGGGGRGRERREFESRTGARRSLTRSGLGDSRRRS